ncbi:30S ribosomal protein S4 [Porphyridium purpureum]|uniref:30S ribosomal protein S4 n=1 Tax=Porphyridium purpureum TaxID=35688 RepID=A0A5J4YYB0_PORPP|nr:30S ribosomal protein S4 [Porphyridium purpureum]|eukprot:POR0191..scf209_3
MARSVSLKRVQRLFVKEIESEARVLESYADADNSARRPRWNLAEKPQKVQEMHAYMVTNNAPRQGPNGKSASGMFGTQALIEKQKMRTYYGNMRDFKFKRLVRQARESGGTNPSEFLMRRLELRLDTMLYRTCMVWSMRQSQKLVKDGHVLVNGKRCTHSNRELRTGDVFAIHPSMIGTVAAIAIKVASRRMVMGLGQSWVRNSPLGMVSYLEVNREGLSAVLVREPRAEELGVLTRAAFFPYLRDANLNPQRAMAYYK